MSIWVIIGIAYPAFLLFALALARVASPPDPDDQYRDPVVDDPDRASAALAGAGGNLN